MGTLIDDLLMFSRTGRTELLKQKINTSKMVKEIVEQNKISLNGRVISFHINNMPHINADKLHLKLVFENLISNAVKYTSKKEKAEISIGCDTSSQDEYIFFVKDNGAGFDQKYSDKLFLVFQRLHNDKEFEGTGIGLATVKRIIYRHGEEHGQKEN
jgi:light-regulated signal transduction histidine kinase (bacteriophytochrome)